MESQQQVRLTDISQTNNKRQQTQYGEQLIKDKISQSITLFVIIFIIILNYFQLRALRSNYANIQAILEQTIGMIEKNKVQLDQESINRTANQTQLRDTITNLINKNHNQFLEKHEENRSQMQKYKVRLSKLSENLNKLKKSTENMFKQQQQSHKYSNNSLIQSKIIPNVRLQFLFQHSKDQFHSFKTNYLKSLINKTVFNDQKAKQSFLTAFYNLKQSHQNIITSNERKAVQNKIYSRLYQQYEFSKYTKELPFCIVVPTYNNAFNFRYQYNLQSVLNLDYKNYKIVIIDDASTDGTYELLKQLIDQLEFNENISLIRNQIKMTAVANINKAIRQHCSESDIVVLVDGDDQLLVKHSLKVYNSIYQKQDIGVLYSNHLKLYWHQDQVFKGWSQDYSQQEKSMNMYRQIPQKISHLRSFKASLFLQIKQQDLKHKNGQWLESAYDEVICLPILQMSCGKIKFVEEYFYLYNFGIGTNELFVDPDKQKQIADYVRLGKKYQCIQKS